MISFISSFENIKLFEIVVREVAKTSRFKYFLMNSYICFCRCGVNPSGIKTLLARGSSAFFIKGNPVSSNGPKRLPKNLLECSILCN